MLHHAGVFARMSPDDKRLLVELLGEGALAADGTELPGLGNFVGEAGGWGKEIQHGLFLGRRRWPRLTPRVGI